MKDSFRRIWKRKVPTAAILKTGYDFPDTRTHMIEHIFICMDMVLSAKQISELQNHQSEARSEYLN